MRRSGQAKQFLCLVWAPLPGDAVRERYHRLCHLPRRNLELADVDVVDRQFGQALLGRGVGSRAYLEEVVTVLGKVQVEVGLFSSCRHHDVASEWKFTSRCLHTGAACLEVCQGIVEADVFLTVQIKIGFSLVIRFDCGLNKTFTPGQTETKVEES